ncbi:MAG: hypothetical protein KF749_02770 [Bacteroidetes bacterium]|nr:hypothetical protein [Bacteroidota bacterium]MCW5896739.1 hypothetical protein [Bacteroidota bacterium]
MIMKHAAFQLSPALRRNLLLLAGAGLIITAIGVIVNPAATWPNILLAAYYLLSLGIAGAVFIALLFVTNAGWAVAFRRVPEAMTSVLPVAALAMFVVLFGIGTLYEWSHQDVVAADHMLHEKAGWLNVPFFVIRTVIYLGLWLLFVALLVKYSRKQDASGDITLTAKSTKLSAVFLVVFALTFTVASMDWIMSLEPHWYSTIFGIYNFCGLLLNGLAAITIVVILLRRWGPLQRVVNESHLHDLGKLIFAFSTFWMYIWFSQYILIWYANIPEEVVYYLRREQGSWLIFTGLNVVFNWVIPFAVLLPQSAKRNEGLLFKVCIIIMIGHWIDLFWMILPPFHESGPEFSLWVIGPIAAALAYFFFGTFRALSRAPVVPVKDPMLEESLHLS